LSGVALAAMIAVLHTDRFIDPAPAQVWTILLRDIASVR